MSTVKARPAAIAPAGRITVRVAISMTTPGAVLLSATAPALLGVLLASETLGTAPSLGLSALLVLIPTLMNAAVDVLNDYYDYVRGNDTAQNIVSESDAPLAYHRVADPRPALWLGMALLVAAALMGVYVVWRTGLIPAVIGLAGMLILLTYSGGKLPTSHLPIGEALAGFTMGGLVPLGVYAALTGRVDGVILYRCIPMMFIVSQFMLVNNTCDMERDRLAGRRTLPILIGRAAAQRLADVCSVLWMVQLLHVTLTWYIKGLPILLIALAFCLKGVCAAFCCERTAKNKIPATAAVALSALSVAVGYPLAVAVHLLLS